MGKLQSFQGMNSKREREIHSCDGTYWPKCAVQDICTFEEIVGMSGFTVCKGEQNFSLNAEPNSGSLTRSGDKS